MSHQIIVSRSWCKQCLRDCFQAYDESTRTWSHIGPQTIDLADYCHQLQSLGYWVRQRAGVYTFTRFKPVTPESVDPLLAYIDAHEQDW